MAGPDYHGRTHRPGGSDPFGSIVYDYLNVGDWLSIRTTGPEGIEVYVGDIVPDLIVADAEHYRITSGTTDGPGFIVLDGTNDDGSETASFWVGFGITASDGVHPDYPSDGIVAWVKDTMTFSVLGGDVIPVLEIQGDYEVDWRVNRMTVKLENAADFAVIDSGSVEIVRVSEAGEIFATLPTSPGTAGSLYKSGGFVKVA